MQLYIHLANILNLYFDHAIILCELCYIDRIEYLCENLHRMFFKKIKINKLHLLK